MEEIERLTIPEIGAGRTLVYLETAAALVKQANTGFVLGGMIGPFSLAARIFGVSELLQATISSPDLVETLLEKCVKFLTEYALVFRETGATGLVMAEPAAGLISPNGLARFSSAPVRQIIEHAQREDYAIIYHNCGARLVHLPRILEAGADIYHFGQPMDLPNALVKADGKSILCGNLDPAGVFLTGSEQEVAAKTRALMDSCSPHRNFIPSSGCDLPPGVTLANVAAFYRTVREGLQG
jgi:uroporphyrinogen decarboxylase